VSAEVELRMLKGSLSSSRLWGCNAKSLKQGLEGKQRLCGHDVCDIIDLIK